MADISRRHVGVALYVLCLTALIVVGFLAAFGQRWLHRGIGYGTPREVPLAAVYPYGVNVALEQYDAIALEQALTRVEEAGFGWVRQVFPWDAIEPQPGVYRWTRWDRIVEAVARRDLRLIAVIDGTPPWARHPADAANPRALPADPADLARFVGAFVQRYGPRVTAVEIWREPNLRPRAEAGGPNPGEYVAHLRAAYAAAKAANPGIVVLNAGLAPTTENSERAMSDVDFLEGMYDAGARPYFDVLAARPLGFWSGPEDRRVDPRVLNFSRVLLLREVMVRHGDAGKAVWAVEFGWNALPPDWTGEPAPWGSDDAQKQARRTANAVRRALSEWPWMGAMAILHLDPDAPPNDPIHGFALLDENLNPRPTYEVLRDLIAEGRVGLGRYPHDAWFVGTTWRPIPGAVVTHTADGDIVVQRPAPFGRFYLAMGLLLATAAVVAWRLDRLVHLPRWELLLAASTVVFLLSPWLPLTLASLLALFALFVLRLDLALALIVLFIPFFRFPRYIGPQPFSVLELFTWLALAAWLTRQLVHHAPRITHHAPRITHHASRTTHHVSRITHHASRITHHVSHLTPLDLGVAFLVAISLPSPLIAENRGVAIHELRVVIIDSALFYFLVRFSSLSRQQLWRLADALVLTGLVVALYGFYQYLVTGDVIVVEGVRRMRGVYPSPNNLSLFLGRIVPLAGVLGVWGSRGWRRGFYGVAVGVMTGALFLTFSRAAWLVGLPVALLFVGLVRGLDADARQRRRVLIAATGAVAVVILSVLPFASTPRIASLLDLSPGSSTYRRLRLWQASLQMIRDHPFFGVGLDNFLYQYRSRYLLPGAEDDPNLSHPHNLFLDFWTRLGIPGLVALFWLVAAFFRTGWRLYRSTQGATQALALSLMASMVYALAHGLLDNSYFLVDLAYVFMLVAGMMGALSHHRSQFGTGNRRQSSSTSSRT
jgi:O-antigen ligase